MQSCPLHRGATWDRSRRTNGGARLTPLSPRPILLTCASASPSPAIEIGFPTGERASSRTVSRLDALLARQTPVWWAFLSVRWGVGQLADRPAVTREVAGSNPAAPVRLVVASSSAEEGMADPGARVARSRRCSRLER